MIFAPADTQRGKRRRTGEDGQRGELAFRYAGRAGIGRPGSPRELHWCRARGDGVRTGEGRAGGGSAPATRLGARRTGGRTGGGATAGRAHHLLRGARTRATAPGAGVSTGRRRRL